MLARARRPLAATLIVKHNVLLVDDDPGGHS